MIHNNLMKIVETSYMQHCLSLFSMSTGVPVIKIPMFKEKTRKKFVPFRKSWPHYLVKVIKK